nr:hypothetical protein BaRGS_009743 [Batillaria attramentaria]
MFSAFVDKAFAPNPYFWHIWGKPSIVKFRKNATAASRRCGHDVTFAEVMSYAAEKSAVGPWDIHFDSVDHLCQPCGFKYDVIGKMETFSDDLGYLAKHLNLSLTGYFTSDKFRYEYVKDAIEDTVNSPFRWMSKIRRCMSKYEAGLRIWRKLQIRGIIDRNIQLPYNLASFERVTAKQLIESALSSYRQSTDRERLRRQKRDAFLEAYSTVNKKALHKMKRVFEKDFDMFGYDPEPADVFHPVTVTSTGAFQWDRPWGGSSV